MLMRECFWHFHLLQIFWWIFFVDITVLVYLLNFYVLRGHFLKVTCSKLFNSEETSLFRSCWIIMRNKNCIIWKWYSLYYHGLKLYIVNCWVPFCLKVESGTILVKDYMLLPGLHTATRAVVKTGLAVCFAKLKFQNLFYIIGRYLRPVAKKQEL